MGSSRHSTSLPANRMRDSSTRRRSPPDSTPTGRSMRSRPDAEPGGERSGLAVGGVAAGRAEVLLGPGVAGHVALVGPLLHGDAQLLEALELLVDAPSGQDVRHGACGRRARRRCAGPVAGSRRHRAADRRVPAAGSASPPRTRNRLVLPAPLRPTRPTLSRGITVKSTDSTTRRPPTSTDSPGGTGRRELGLQHRRLSSWRRRGTRLGRHDGRQYRVGGGGARLRGPS